MTVKRRQVGDMRKACQNSMWCFYFPTFKLLEIPAVTCRAAVDIVVILCLYF